jgi:hypothetical protein
LSYRQHSAIPCELNSKKSEAAQAQSEVIMIFKVVIIQI